MPPGHHLQQVLRQVDHYSFSVSRALTMANHEAGDKRKTDDGKMVMRAVRWRESCERFQTVGLPASESFDPLWPVLYGTHCFESLLTKWCLEPLPSSWNQITRWRKGEIVSHQCLIVNSFWPKCDSLKVTRQIIFGQFWLTNFDCAS